MKQEAREKRRVARQIKQREAELAAQVEARRLQLEAARVEEVKLEVEARLLEIKKVQQQQEAKRLEAEWLERERESFREVELSKKQDSVEAEAVVDVPKKKLPEHCVGPAAKFKITCR